MKHDPDKLVEAERIAKRRKQADDLLKAAEILRRDGWTTCRLIDATGRHCIIGALMEAQKNYVSPGSIFESVFAVAVDIPPELFARCGASPPRALWPQDVSPITNWNDQQCFFQWRAVRKLKLAARDILRSLEQGKT